MVSERMQKWLSLLVENGVFKDEDYALECFLYCAARLWTEAGLTPAKVKAVENEQVEFPITDDPYEIEHLHYQARFGTIIEDGLALDKHRAAITQEKNPAVGSPEEVQLNTTTWMDNLVRNGVFENRDAVREAVLQLAHDFCVDGGIDKTLLRTRFAISFPITDLDSVEKCVQKFLTGTIFEMRYDENAQKAGYPPKYKKAVVTKVFVEDDG